MRISWVHPELAARTRRALLDGRGSWEEAFVGDRVLLPEPPPWVEAGLWPELAEHVARAARVEATVAQAGFAEAERRFGESSHAVERAALAAARIESPGAGSPEAEAADARAVLGCEIDERVAYGHFLSRLVELCLAVDPAGTVAQFESFVAAAAAYPANEPSWAERLHAAEDGLASLYVRVGRADEAEAVYRRRHDEDKHDAIVAIGAARAFLEAGMTARAVLWLELGAERAAGMGRAELAGRLGRKAGVLRARLS